MGRWAGPEVDGKPLGEQEGLPFGKEGITHRWVNADTPSGVSHREELGGVGTPPAD